MRKNLVILLLVIITVSLGIRLARYTLDARAYKVGSNNTDVQILTRMEHDVVDAYLRHDTALANRVMAVDYRAQYISCDEAGSQLHELPDAREEIVSADIHKMNAHTYGATGVVIGTSLVKAKSEGKEIIYDEHFVDTFAKRDERWQLVASQHTRFKRKA